MYPAGTNQVRDGVVPDHQAGVHGAAISIVNRDPVGSSGGARDVLDRIPFDHDIRAWICRTGVADVYTFGRSGALNVLQIVGQDLYVVRAVLEIDGLGGTLTACIRGVDPDDDIVGDHSPSSRRPYLNPNSVSYMAGVRLSKTYTPYTS